MSNSINVKPRKHRKLKPHSQGHFMEQISIASIIVENRFRQDMGDLAGLSKSIAELGQLQPIIINKDRRLIAGGRRLEAMKMLGHQTIAASVFDLDDIAALKVERDENDQRKEPTISEKVALAEAIAERLQGRVGVNQHTAGCGNISIPTDKGATRDIAASKAGLGSGKTLEAAQKVIERDIPELTEAMDRGKVSINAAKSIATLPADEVRVIDFDDKQAVRRAANKVYKRENRARQKPEFGLQSQHKNILAPATNGESKLYEAGSSLSAFVLASRAIHSISQISKNDPNALAAIEDIRAALEQQITHITA